MANRLTGLAAGLAAGDGAGTWTGARWGVLLPGGAPLAGCLQRSGGCSEAIRAGDAWALLPLAAAGLAAGAACCWCSWLSCWATAKRLMGCSALGAAAGACACACQAAPPAPAGASAACWCQGCRPGLLGMAPVAL
jgi:hypothetical protein